MAYIYKDQQTNKIKVISTNLWGSPDIRFNIQKL